MARFHRALSRSDYALVGDGSKPKRTPRSAAVCVQHIIQLNKSSSSRRTTQRERSNLSVAGGVWGELRTL